MATHVLACGLPHRKQHALALVVACTVLVGLTEIAEHDRAVHCRHDLGESDLLRGTGQNVPTSDPSLGTHEPRALEGQEDLFEVRLRQTRALCDVAH